MGKSGMRLLTGEFNVTLDEKGRISLPATLRKQLDEESLTLTQNREDKCLWLFPTNEYNALLQEVGDNTHILSKEDRELRRRLYNSHEVEVDKAGRIPIVPNFRTFAGLAKNCVVLGQGQYIEIWDEERYNQYLESSEGSFVSASEKLGNKLKNSGGDR
jgi:MraZ protein